MTDAKRRRNIYVIGDTHGEYGALLDVLRQIKDDGFEGDHDLLIQLGDIIDGGNRSKQCLGLLRFTQTHFPDSAEVLLGNHEDLLLRSVGKHEGQSDFRTWWYQGGKATHQSYDPDFDETQARFLMGAHGYPTEGYKPPPQLEQDIQWLKERPLYYEDDTLIVVHAGLRPPLPPAANKKRDMLWIREEFFNSGYDWPKTIVYGHTARSDFLVSKKTIGIDLMYHTHGRVGAVKLHNGQLIRTFVGDS